jgi:S-(hydroxymethyl)glutathione dehydrogenase/alcohol dehydrogenase
MRAAILSEFNQPLHVEEIDIEEPRAGEVLVRVHASGVCRSDLHVVHGRSVVSRVPMVLGHEGAGVVEQVGEGVHGVAPGDPVVIALYGPCGACGDCRSGRIERCMSETRQNNMYGLMPDGSTRLSWKGQVVYPMVGAGSLAELAVVREAQVVRIPPDVPFEHACLTGCGVTTGVGAALNVAKVQPGSSVAVIGCGGVGLNVIQGARIAGATRIIAVDTQTPKLDLASDLGATDVAHVSPGESISEAVQKLVPGGVDYAFEVVGSPALVREAFASTRAGGAAVMVGSPPSGEDIAVDGRLLFSDRRLLGTMGGSNIPQRDIPRLMDLYQHGALDLDKLISQRLPLSEVNVAFDALEEGKLARSLVLPNTR